MLHLAMQNKITHMIIIIKETNNKCIKRYKNETGILSLKGFAVRVILLAKLQYKNIIKKNVDITNSISWTTYFNPLYSFFIKRVTLI